MSIEDHRPEQLQVPSAKEVVRQTLEAMSIGPELMHKFARKTMEGAVLLGTDLTLYVGEKKTNPRIFSYDFKAAATTEGNDDGPHHEGFAKIFVPTEGVKPMLASEGGATGFLNLLVRQVLKRHRKGMDSDSLKPGDEPITSKAGNLSGEQTARLSRAAEAVIDYLMGRVAGSDEPASQEALLAVASWVDSDATEADGGAVITNIVDRLAPTLAELVELAQRDAA